MAGIDKIYGTQEQYYELKEWLLKNEKPIPCIMGWSSKAGGDIIKYVLPSDCLYEESWGNEEHRPISNFPEEVDMWLKDNCPLDFVQERLKEQYK